MPGVARVAMAFAIGAFMVAMSCRVVANEAPLQMAALTPQPSFSLPPRSDSEPSGIASTPFSRKWRNAEASIRRDIEAAAQCLAGETPCSPETRKLNELAATARTLSARAQLGVINREINLTIAASSDGVDDVWSPPLETLASGKGDCEDYAILKIAILRAAGMNAGDLRLMVVRDPSSPDLHAVAAARLDGRWLILDNRRFALVDAGHSDYRELHAFQMQDEPRDTAFLAGPSGSGGAPVLM